MPALFQRTSRNSALARQMTMAQQMVVGGLTMILVLATSQVQAQLINVSQPFRTSSGSFFNRTGVNFGFSLAGNSRIRGLNAAGQITPNINVTQNSAGTTLPQFGGYDPNAALRSGVGVFGGNGGFSLGLVAGKGNTRSLVSSTPSVTMFNGQSGSIFSGETRPFVTGITPVIGNSSGVGLAPAFYGVPPGFDPSAVPVRPVNNSPRSWGNAESTATQGALGLAEITRMKANAELEQQAQLNGEVAELVTEARRLVENEKFGAARVKFSRALRMLGENENALELRSAVATELDAIRDKR